MGIYKEKNKGLQTFSSTKALLLRNSWLVLPLLTSEKGKIAMISVVFVHLEKAWRENALAS